MLTIPQRLTKYLWLSWLWGAVLAVPCLMLVLYLIFQQPSSGPLELVGKIGAGLVSLLPLLLVSAWVGSLLRRPCMPALLRRAEAAASLRARIAWLAGGTALLFIASVLFCTVVFMLLFFELGPTGSRRLTQPDLLWPIVRVFFLLSAPWLLTAPLAACWVCRDWLRLQPQRA